MKKQFSNSVLYQIYPTSFYDSNGDGVGDLQGIKEKLDYVKDLGADIIWLNPINQSAFKDGGYDVIDYRTIDPMFGTMQDFKALLKRAKELQLKVCIDLVAGHTSWESEWFKKSAEKERNKYSDYYIWTENVFTTYKDKTISGLSERDGCFYVNYYACQPALNYGFNNVTENWQMHYTDERLTPLREELINIIKFWLDMGVDGFRVDMANSLVKGCVYNSDKDEEIEGLKWLWNKIFAEIRPQYPNAIFISEWVYPKNAVGKCGFDIDIIAHDNEPWNTLFRYEKNTNLIPFLEKGDNYFSEHGKGSVIPFLTEAEDINCAVKGKGWFSAPTGSHDEIRLATGKPESVLKTAFAFLLTFKHFPFIYYGDEIGITHDFTASKHGGYIRTGARTPMQWNDQKNRGFSNANTPYLNTNNQKGVSVESQTADKNSLLNTVKELIKIRKEYTCLGAEGEFKVIECVNGGYPLVYERADDNGKITVAINPAQTPATVEVSNKKLIYSNNCRAEGAKYTLSSGFAIFEG